MVAIPMVSLVGAVVFSARAFGLLRGRDPARFVGPPARWRDGAARARQQCGHRAADMRARNALLLLCVLFALTPAARAATPASVFIEDLTWTELRDLIAAGTTTVTIPIGGTEQNGPHMALGRHNVRVRLPA